MKSVASDTSSSDDPRMNDTRCQGVASQACPLVPKSIVATRRIVTKVYETNASLRVIHCKTNTQNDMGLVHPLGILNGGSL